MKPIVKPIVPVRDEDPVAPPAAPEIPSEEFPRDTGPGRLERHFAVMREVFGRVQDMLDAFGVSHVSDLDSDRRQIVIVYLESARERIESDRP